MDGLIGLVGWLEHIGWNRLVGLDWLVGWNTLVGTHWLEQIGGLDGAGALLQEAGAFK